MNGSWKSGARLLQSQPNLSLSKWSDAQVTLSWIGHATVLINFFGVTILTDPVLFPRTGIRLLGFTVGPKRLTGPALSLDELPKIDVVLLSHAHFDHLDLRTLRCFDESASVITPRATKDLLQKTRFSHVTELDWGQNKSVSTPSGEIKITALRVKHWGARIQRDMYRGYSGCLIERNGRRITFTGDTAMTEIFVPRQRHGAIDVAIMSISAYNPWIQSHSTPEQAVQMANATGARFVVPVHHQTFRLGFEPFRQPIQRFEAALSKTPERIALREIGQKFLLPL
jgi:L-ascorbate metabolism protein UlaG (beta-lactamase superfamily)